MANKEHLKILKQGVESWNKWRSQNPLIKPLLSGTDLRDSDLSGANLAYADLHFAKLFRTKLVKTNLSNTNLRRAKLANSNLSQANLKDANLQNADLISTNFSYANLSNANLSESNLSGAVFSSSNIKNTNMSLAIASLTVFADLDMRSLKGLKTIEHLGPSTVGIETIYKSGGNIPEVFLRGCGVPENFISYMKFLTLSAIEFYSAFISYSSKDDEFAKQLHSKMRDEQIRVWFAPEEMKAGRKIHEQIDEAIKFHDKLVLILSEESMRSEWVITEIRKARKAEKRESRQKLFPIRLVNFEKIQEWECFDSDTGKDLAVEIREYFIPDFSNWKDHDSFEKAFARLLKDLQAEKPVET